MKIIANLILLFLIKHVVNRPYDLLVDYDYMARWYVIPRNRFFNIYLHDFYGSNGDTMHDHPWCSASFVLDGYYIEHTPKGEFYRKAGSLTFRKPTSLHWIEVEQPVLTLFVTGPVIRNWGFQCNDEWVPHEVFLASRGTDRKANGC